MTVMPELYLERCDGCGRCVAACHGGGVVLDNGRVKIVETESCDFCAVCEAVCPRGAIRCAYVIVLDDG